MPWVHDRTCCTFHCFCLHLTTNLMHVLRASIGAGKVHYGWWDILSFFIHISLIYSEKSVLITPKTVVRSSIGSQNFRDCPQNGRLFEAFYVVSQADTVCLQTPRAHYGLFSLIFWCEIGSGSWYSQRYNNTSNSHNSSPAWVANEVRLMMGSGQKLDVSLGVLLWSSRIK